MEEDFAGVVIKQSFAISNTGLEGLVSSCNGERRKKGTQKRAGCFGYVVGHYDSLAIGLKGRNLRDVVCCLV